MSTPCSGELQFWASTRSSLKEISAHLERIANALEAMNAAPADRGAGGVYYIEPPDGTRTEVHSRKIGVYMQAEGGAV